MRKESTMPALPLQTQRLLPIMGKPFHHYYPETEGCAGYHQFGFNCKEQFIRIIVYPFIALAACQVKEVANKWKMHLFARQGRAIRGIKSGIPYLYKISILLFHFPL